MMACSMMALLGVPELDLRIDELEVRVNQGSYVPGPGAWPSTPGLFPPPVIDFISSYPDDSFKYVDDDNDGSTPRVFDADSEADGYHVRANTAGDTVALQFDEGVVGASADRVLLRISDFVYVSGGFSFNKGGAVGCAEAGFTH